MCPEEFRNEAHDATTLRRISQHGSVFPRSLRVMPARTAKLLAYALSLPEAWEDHPWNETVVKVRTKVFVFFSGKVMTVKLVESHAHALSVDGAEPTGYGLAAPAGSMCRSRRAADVLRDWIEESYRIVAPKRLAASLDT